MGVIVCDFQILHMRSEGRRAWEGNGGTGGNRSGLRAIVSPGGAGLKTPAPGWFQQLLHILGPVPAGSAPDLGCAPPTAKVDGFFATLPWHRGHLTSASHRWTILSKPYWHWLHWYSNKGMGFLLCVSVRSIWITSGNTGVIPRGRKTGTDPGSISNPTNTDSGAIALWNPPGFRLQLYWLSGQT